MCRKCSLCLAHVGPHPSLGEYSDLWGLASGPSGAGPQILWLWFFSFFSFLFCFLFGVFCLFVGFFWPRCTACGILVP